MSLRAELNLQHWFDILKAGFSADSIVLSDDLNLTIFQKFIFRAAYANFPFGIRTNKALEQIHSTETDHQLRKAGIDLLRINFPENLSTAHQPGIILPEAAISDLKNWAEDNLDSGLRYKLRRARREGVAVREATAHDATWIHATYAETIRRNHGNLRYNLVYFQALCGTKSPGLSILIALSPQGERCGFIVTARHNAIAYYLHGGYETKNAKYRPGFVLMRAAIEQARDAGCDSFNFMTSPTNQTSLVDFKEKWGADLYQINHLDYPLNLKGRVTEALLRLRR